MQCGLPLRLLLGATGAVGTEFLKLIEERNFPFAELRLLASKRSAGKQIEFMGKTYTVQEATKDSFEGFFSHFQLKCSLPAPISK